MTRAGQGQRQFVSTEGSCLPWAGAAGRLLVVNLSVLLGLSFGAFSSCQHICWPGWSQADRVCVSPVPLLEVGQGPSRNHLEKVSLIWGFYFHLKSSPKHKSLPRKGEIPLTLVLSVVHCLLLLLLLFWCQPWFWRCTQVVLAICPMSVKYGKIC